MSIVSPIYIVDAADIAWRATGRPGLALKIVREDPAAGIFLGAVGFEPGARSGLHQHLGVATSYFASGGLSDYGSTAVQHDVGVNLKGSTHDAIAYDRSLLISRVEGPVVYPAEGDVDGAVHVGARHQAVTNPAPELPPEFNVHVPSLQAYGTGVSGWRRRTIFDYAGTGDNFRMAQWLIRPGMQAPPLQLSAALELWIHAGAMTINGLSAHGNCFVIIEPGTRVEFASAYGARVIAWIEGPPSADAVERPESIFGY